MKLAITICRPCRSMCLYDFTGNIESIYETHIIELPNLPSNVMLAIEEKEACGCITNISFVKEETK